MKLPLGFRYASAYAGIRKQERDDLALIVPERPANAAAVFTQNMVQAAPVRLAREHIRTSHGVVSAILVNAGNANCATRTGDAVAAASCKAVAKALNTKTKLVLPASTGVIGVELDAKLLTDAIPKLVSSLSTEGFDAVAQAILTTDLRKKVAFEDLPLAGGNVRVAGMTKGSGMIQPNMATTLGFLMTDAAVEPRFLREMLADGVKRSYNSLTVDGDTSTNDTLVLLANGAAQVRPNAKERKLLAESIARVMESLAAQIAADGEGASKLITVHAVGFKTDDEARAVARAIANSPLVKTAMGGNDPNWGRILAAAGYAGVPFDPAKTDVYLQHKLVCQGGLAADYDEAALKQDLAGSEVTIQIALHDKGNKEARFFTCDFTEGYIRINGSYRT